MTEKGAKELLLQDPEIQRLKSQVEFSIADEMRFWEMAGIEDGMNILEVGCGPGWMTKILLEKYPHSQITGIDIDPKMVKAFKELLTSSELERSQVIQGSINEVELVSNTFDVAIVRVVLQYVNKAQDAINQIFEWLKPGGLILVVDTDRAFSFTFEPSLPTYKIAHTKILDHLDANNIVAPNIGRYLPKYFKNSGFIDTQIHAIVKHSDIEGVDSMMGILYSAIHQNYYQTFIDQGVINAEEAKSAKDEVKTFLELDEKMIIGSILVCFGFKPN